MVRTSDASKLLCRLWPDPNGRRLPPQCRLSFVRYYNLFFEANPSQWASHSPSHSPLVHTGVFQVQEASSEADASKTRS